jgi:hypothetical protein
MTRIVHTAYRYKRPPRRKKPVAIEVPEVVTIRDRKRAAKQVSEGGSGTPAPQIDRKIERPDPPAPGGVTAVAIPPTGPRGKPVQGQLALAANDDRQLATMPSANAKPSTIVTVRKRNRVGTAKDITAAEGNRRADLVDAMMQDFKRQISEKLR